MLPTQQLYDKLFTFLKTTLGSRLVAGLWILVPATEVQILSSQPSFTHSHYGFGENAIINDIL